MTSDVAAEIPVSGHQLEAMLVYAAHWLERNAAAINAINVFPVPDGDTGSNMSATLNAAVQADRGTPNHAGQVLAAMARGALLGARGNSGVILSQIFAGLAEDAADAEELDAARFASALAAADRAASLAVTEPRAGTILTVLTDSARAAAAAAHDGASLTEVMEVAAAAAKASVERTPELLPLLKEAGVVDAGGSGLAVILDGCLMFLRDQEIPDGPSVPDDDDNNRARAASKAPRGHSTGDRPFGYCTEFIVEGRGLTRDALLAELRPAGESLLVVTQGTLFRVHIHTQDPGAVLSIGSRHGPLTQIKIENMDAQRDALTRQSPAGEPANASVVAVALGAGFEELLRGYGAIVVRGGQTMNPSTKEMLDAVNEAPGREIYLLPDNSNAIAAAEQAARLTSKPVHILRTSSVPQGIAALLAFNSEREATANETAMNEAAAAVRTVEVTRAARAVALDAVRAEKGQPIALLDGMLAAAGDTIEDVTLAMLARLPGGETATIYFGANADQPMAEALATALRAIRPELTVDVVPGGQPSYDYVISLE